MAETSRYQQGMATRRAVLGDAHVDRATKGQTGFDEDFQTFITEGAWGSVWSRPGLTHRERSILTLALLAALGQPLPQVVDLSLVPAAHEQRHRLREGELRTAVERDELLPVDLERHGDRRAVLAHPVDVHDPRVLEDGGVVGGRVLGLTVEPEVRGDLLHRLLLRVDLLVRQRVERDGAGSTDRSKNLSDGQSRRVRASRE